MRIACLNRETETEVFASIGLEDSPKAAREFCVTSRKVPFLREGRYWTAGCIRRLLVESIETGNPIRWE
jgi:hypothetical protein